MQKPGYIIMIDVQFIGMMKQLAGCPGFDTQARTVAELLKEIKSLYGADAGKKAKMSHIIINGESAGSYRVRLHEGDKVQIIPVCGGG